MHRFSSCQLRSLNFRRYQRRARSRRSLRWKRQHIPLSLFRSHRSLIEDVDILEDAVQIASGSIDGSSTGASGRVSVTTSGGTLASGAIIVKTGQTVASTSGAFNAVTSNSPVNAGRQTVVVYTKSRPLDILLVHRRKH